MLSLFPTAPEPQILKENKRLTLIWHPHKQTLWTIETRRNTKSMISMTGSFHVDSTFRILFLFSKFCDEICFYVHIIAFRPNIGKLLFPCFILFNTFFPILPLSCYFILFYPIMHTTKVALNIFTNTSEYYRRQIKVLLHVPYLNSP